MLLNDKISLRTNINIFNSFLTYVEEYWEWGLLLDISMIIL